LTGAAEGAALHRQPATGHSQLLVVIPTGAKRSGGICGSKPKHLALSDLRCVILSGGVADFATPESKDPFGWQATAVIPMPVPHPSRPLLGKGVGLKMNCARVLPGGSAGLQPSETRAHFFCGFSRREEPADRDGLQRLYRNWPKNLGVG